MQTKTKYILFIGLIVIAMIGIFGSAIGDIVTIKGGNNAGLAGQSSLAPQSFSGGRRSRRHIRRHRRHTRYYHHRK